MAEPGGGETKAEPKAATGPQTFTFHLPDGKSASITAPRGTTTEQAWGYLTTQHPEYGSRAQTQEAPARDPNAPDPVGFIAGLGQGIADIPEAAGQMIQKGGEALGVDPSRLVPGFVQRGAEALRNRAGASTAGQVGELISGLGAFALQPELGFLKAGQGIQRAAPWIERLLKPAGRVATRSTLPAVLQPTNTRDPDFWNTKLWQAITGTGIGEALQQLGRVAGVPLKKWAAEDKRAANEAKLQQRVAQLNQQNERTYRAAQVQHEADVARQLDMPRQATQDVLNDARGLIGLRPLQLSMTRQTAPQALREVGQELDRLYGKMSFDPNQGGWLRSAARIQADIRNRLRQDPRAQALWEQVFQDKAFMPGLRAEAGAGAPVMGVAPGVVRPPVGTGPGFAQRSLPTGEVQGPLGTRSGPISGEQLARMMSVLTKAQQRFGLEAQQGGGVIYRDMADGLRQMRQSIERQLDAKFPTLAQHRQLANQAYFLTSRVMDAVDVHGSATPEALLKAFKSAEGDTRFGTDKRYADIKDRLERQHREHTTKLDPPKAPVTIKGQPATQSSPGMPGAAAHIAAHFVPGGPTSRMIAREILRQGGRGVAEPALRGAARARRLGPPASAVAGQAVSQPQELVVTPKGAHWEDQRRN